MMTITATILVVMCSVVGALTSTGCCSVKRLHHIFQQQQQQQRQRQQPPTSQTGYTRRQLQRSSNIPLEFSRESLEKCDSAQPWIDTGLLLSSFTDGLMSNRDAQDWLCEAIVERLWHDVQRRSEEVLHQSNTFSPCNGPDPVMWQQLEDIDQQVQELYPKTNSIDDTRTSSWKRSLERLWIQQQQSKVGEFLEVRLLLLYIPTALYALRKDSINTPGKQRQRARADGKKRRNQLVAMLQENFDGVAISAVTLDLDDGSVKQADCTLPNVNVTFPMVRKRPRKQIVFQME